MTNDDQPLSERDERIFKSIAEHDWMADLDAEGKRHAVNARRWGVIWMIGIIVHLVWVPPLALSLTSWTPVWIGGATLITLTCVCLGMVMLTQPPQRRKGR
jgi:hypothetical protein